MKPRRAEPGVMGATGDAPGATAMRLVNTWAHPQRAVAAALAAGRAAALGAVLASLLTACSSPPSKPSSPAQARLETASQSAASAMRRGDLNAALMAYQAALAAAESVEDFESAGGTLLNLAAVHTRLGQAEAAHTRLDRILGAPQHFSVSLQGQAAARKALVLVDQGQMGPALQWADRSQTGCANACAWASAMNNLRAFVALTGGDWQGASAWATQATEQAAAAGLAPEQANGLRLAGRAQSQLGNTERAAALLARALQIDQALGLPERIASDLQHAAENEVRRGQLAAARAFYERALVVSQALGDATRSAALRQLLQGLPAATPR